MTVTTGSDGGALSRVWQSRFLRSVALIASGTAGAQAITIAFSPLITRIYGPEAFGLLGTFMAIVAAAIPLAALAYPIAIVLPKSDRDALGLVRLSAVLSVVVALLVGGALWAVGDWLTDALGAEPIAEYLLLIPLAMLFSAWMQIAQLWLIRMREFGVVARVALMHSLTMNTAKAGFGWFYPAGVTLILASTFGNALYALFLSVGALRRYKGHLNCVEQAPAATLSQLLHCYRDFPIYRAPQNFINAASQSLPVLMLAAFFGPVAAGFYAISYMVMGMPSALLGKALGDVFYPRITEAARRGENVKDHIIRVTVLLFAVGILPFGLVILFGPWLFGFVFGAEWSEAGSYARWLAVFFLFNFLNKPSVAAVPVLGIQRGLLIYEVFSTGGKMVGLVAGFYWFESDLWAVALFSSIGVLAYIFMILWILSQAKSGEAHGKTG